MATQSIMLTAVPKQVLLTGGGLVGRVLVHVGPRLLTGGTVNDYPDFHDWPATVVGHSWEVVFPSLGFSAPGTVVATLPDSARWQALFPTATPVEGHTFRGYDHRRLYSYPVKGVVDFLAERWGKFGVNDPLDGPTWADLMNDDQGFGPIVFENTGRPAGVQLETGPERKARLLGENDDLFDENSNNPNDWAIPYVDVLPVNVQQRKDAIGRRFLQAEWFHHRGRREEWNNPPPPQPPDAFEPDFHKIVTLVARYPKLMRLLGLVFELEFPLARTTNSANTLVQVTLRPGDALQLPNPPVSARTHCTIDDSTFDAVYNTPPDPIVGDYLALGNSAAYHIAEVDPDGGAIKALQFADNVSRSRLQLSPQSKRSAFTPDRYKLPAHASAGIMVSRLGRATRQAHVFNRALTLNTGAFDAGGNPSPGGEPELWAEDLIRGWRVDLRRTIAGAQWNSLQGVTGTYHLLNNAAADVPVDFNDPNDREEAILIGGATTKGGNADGPDLYLGEPVVRWTGWSLAARMLGLAVGPDDEVFDPDAATTPTDFNIKAALGVPPGSLPALRFGFEYVARARTVDLGYQGPRFDPSLDPPVAGAVSPAIRYHRYEPVQPPDMVLVDKLEGPGDSTRVVVIRSEDISDNAFKETFRHAMPPRGSVQLAEHHAMLDSSPGVPDPTLYPVIAARDAQNLQTHPDGVLVDPSDPSGEKYYPVGHLSVDYLADPLAEVAMVRGLPLTSGQTETIMRFEKLPPYPDFDSWTLHLFSAAASNFDPEDLSLEVGLEKAWDIDVLVSCRFAAAHLDGNELGVWEWIKKWRAAHGGPFTEAQLRTMIIEGRHWMFSPPQLLRLVHAVRTPLAAPDPSQYNVQRPALGVTFAHASRLVGLHRRSTGRIDLVGTWLMNIDTGPGGENPTIPHEFHAKAFSHDINHRNGGPDSEQIEGDHEFGDTKHRFVAYRLVATTPFLEFYTEEAAVNIPMNGPVVVDSAGVEPETVVVKDDNGVEYRQGAQHDYVVDGPAGTIERTPTSSIVAPLDVNVSYVAPEIHNESPIFIENINSSARPLAPKIEYVVPIFGWTGAGTPASPSTRTGNMLRVYMQRPWWTSGDQEQLAVIVWRPEFFQFDPPDELKPLVTMWGFDPVFESDVTAARPTRFSFPLGTPVDGETVDNSGIGLITAETGHIVDVAAHDLQFDLGRDLWFCDIAVNPGNDERSYMPFIRLALARYQQHSLPGVHLSRVALADFIQLTPDRAVTKTQLSPSLVQVTVTGRGYTATSFRNLPSRVRVTMEMERIGVTDPNLKWAVATQRGYSPTFVLNPTITDTNQISWTGPVSLPPSRPRPLRLVIEEVELHRDGFEYDANNPFLAGNAERVVFTDTVNL